MRTHIFFRAARATLLGLRENFSLKIPFFAESQFLRFSKMKIACEKFNSVLLFIIIRLQISVLRGGLGVIYAYFAGRNEKMPIQC